VCVTTRNACKLEGLVISYCVGRLFKTASLISRMSARVKGVSLSTLMAVSWLALVVNSRVAF